MADRSIRLVPGGSCSDEPDDCTDEEAIDTLLAAMAECIDRLSDDSEGLRCALISCRRDLALTYHLPQHYGLAAV
jgi:hypothetical protein